jgi:hypothetical protein
MYPRPVPPIPSSPRPQHTVQSTYAPLQKFVQEQRENAVEALVNLEKGPKTITASTLRNLRKLLTPQARADIIPALTGPRRPQLQEMEKAIDAAARRQWIDFHWTEDNSYLTKELGVHLVSATVTCSEPPGYVCLCVCVRLVV